jgi:hypothetical protein
MNETIPKTENNRIHQGKPHSSSSRKVGYIFSIAFMFLFLYILRHLRQWGVNFLTDDFNKCLYYIELSIYISIAAQAIFIFYDNRWFRHILQAFANIAGAVAIIMLYVIYPFNIQDPTWNRWIKIGLLILFGFTVISIIIELVKGIRDLIREPEKV